MHVDENFSGYNVRLQAVVTIFRTLWADHGSTRHGSRAIFSRLSASRPDLLKGRRRRACRPLRLWRQPMTRSAGRNVCSVMKSPMPAIARVLALFQASESRVPETRGLKCTVSQVCPGTSSVCYHIGLAPTLACLLPAAQPSKVTKGGTGVTV